MGKEPSEERTLSTKLIREEHAKKQHKDLSGWSGTNKDRMVAEEEQQFTTSASTKSPEELLQNIQVQPPV